MLPLLSQSSLKGIKQPGETQKNWEQRTQNNKQLFFSVCKHIYKQIAYFSLLLCRNSFVLICIREHHQFKGYTLPSDVRSGLQPNNGHNTHKILLSLLVSHLGSWPMGKAFQIVQYLYCQNWIWCFLSYGRSLCVQTLKGK